MLIAAVDDDRRFTVGGGDVRPGNRANVDVSCGNGGQEMAEGGVPVRST